jgi:hypothetical protein
VAEVKLLILLAAFLPGSGKDENDDSYGRCSREPDGGDYRYVHKKSPQKKGEAGEPMGV